MNFSFFNKPYPYFYFSLRSFYTYLGIGIFIALFLFVFEPFGISRWQTDHKTLKLVGFGAVSFVFPLLFKGLCNILLSDKWFDAWTVWKEIITLLIMLLVVAFGNLLFSRFLGISSLGIREFINASILTFLVGIFPVVFSVAFKYHKFLALNLREASVIEEAIKESHSEEKEKIQTAENKFELLAENNKDKVLIPSKDLLYIESTGNYCEIAFLANGMCKKQVIRSSLKRLESQLQNSSVVKCHRAFLVNLHNALHIEGNAQGYKISFKDVAETVPVSRQFGKAILDQLKGS